MTTHPIDLQDAGGLCAEHHLGVAVADRVEEVPGGHRRSQHLGQIVGGGVDADAAAFGLRHERAAVHVRAGDLIDGDSALHSLHVPDHRHRGVRQDFVRAEEGLPWRDRQQICPERVDLRQEVCLGRGRHADDGDHRTDPDRDAKRRQGRTQPSGPRPLKRGTEQLRGRQSCPGDALARTRRDGGGAHWRSSETISPSRI